MEAATQFGSGGTTRADDERAAHSNRQQQRSPYMPRRDVPAGVCRISGCGIIPQTPRLRRRKVCELHAKAQSIADGNALVRYCHGCNKPESLADFDGVKTRCRKALLKLKERRRRARGSPVTEAAGTPTAAGNTDDIVGGLPLGSGGGGLLMPSVPAAVFAPHVWPALHVHQLQQQRLADLQQLCVIHPAVEPASGGATEYGALPEQLVVAAPQVQHPEPASHMADWLTEQNSYIGIGSLVELPYPPGTDDSCLNSLLNVEADEPLWTADEECNTVMMKDGLAQFGLQGAIADTTNGPDQDGGTPENGGPDDDDNRGPDNTPASRTCGPIGSSGPSPWRPHPAPAAAATPELPFGSPMVAQQLPGQQGGSSAAAFAAGSQPAKAQQQQAASDAVAASEPAGWQQAQQQQQVMHIFSWGGDWCCSCGHRNFPEQHCKLCGMLSPCREYVYEGGCTRGGSPACKFPHPPFDLPPGLPPTIRHGKLVDDDNRAAIKPPSGVPLHGGSSSANSSARRLLAAGVGGGDSSASASAGASPAAPRNLSHHPLPAHSQHAKQAVAYLAQAAPVAAGGSNAHSPAANRASPLPKVAEVGAAGAGGAEGVPGLAVSSVSSHWQPHPAAAAAAAAAPSELPFGSPVAAQPLPGHQGGAAADVAPAGRADAEVDELMGLMGISMSIGEDEVAAATAGLNLSGSGGGSAADGVGASWGAQPAAAAAGPAGSWAQRAGAGGSGAAGDDMEVLPAGMSAWPAIGESQEDAELQAAIQASLQDAAAATGGFAGGSSSNGMLASSGVHLPGTRAAHGAATTLPDAADVALPGLHNETAEDNFFLNAIIYCLWHCAEFRRLVSGWDATYCAADPVLSSLHALFQQLQQQEAQRSSAASSSGGGGSSLPPLDPGPLREALAEVSVQQFSLGEMDAAEVLLCIYERLMEAAVELDRPSKLDATFGLAVREEVHCRRCTRTTQQCSYTQYFYNRQAADLQMQHFGRGPDDTMGTLLREAEAQHQKSCDMDVGGCGALNPVNHFLDRAPHVFTLQLAWESLHEEPDSIAATLAVVDEEVDLAEVYQGTDRPHRYRLRSMVCFCGQRYLALVLAPKAGCWLLFDDTCVTRVGSWTDVRRKCEAACIQPSVLFYEAAEPKE